MIIDCHVYCLPKKYREFGKKLPSSEERIRFAVYDHPETHFAIKLSAPEQIERSMSEANIDEVLLVSFPWNSHQMCVENNDYILSEAHRNNGFKAICSVQPCDPRWRDEALRCSAAGAIGLKVNADWQGFEMDCKEMRELALFAAEHNLVLMVHVDNITRKSTASPSHLYALSRASKNTKILAAHMGGMIGLCGLHAPYRSALTNVWFDTAISSTLKLIEFYVEAGLTDRIVFGSDYPFNHSHSQAQVVKGIKALGLSSNVEEQIFHKNAKKLFEFE